MPHKATWLIVMLSVLLLFSLQNHRPVRINFLLWRIDANMLVVIALLFAAGFVSGMFLQKRNRSS